MNNQAELSTNTASGIATRSSALASEVTIERCTFMNNTNSIAFTSGVVRSTIIVGDRGQICGATFTISCSNLFSNPGGDAVCATDGGGNFSADPQFCAADPAGSRNFELQADSPCAPGHHPTAVDCGQIGAAPVGCGVVDVEPSTWSAFKNLFR